MMDMLLDPPGPPKVKPINPAVIYLERALNIRDCACNRPTLNKTQRAMAENIRMQAIIAISEYADKLRVPGNNVTESLHVTIATPYGGNTKMVYDPGCNPKTLDKVVANLRALPSIAFYL